MVRAMRPGGRGGGPSPTGLADVIETILDKGLVIDAYIRVSLVGIELLTIDVRIVIASVDTYLRFAEAVSRLDISQDKEGLPGLVGGGQQSSARHITKGVLQGVGDKLREYAESESQPASGRRSRKGPDMAAPIGPEQARELGQSRCYVYGIVPADVEPAGDVRGVGDPPARVELVRQGNLAALVSEVDLTGRLGTPAALQAGPVRVEGLDAPPRPDGSDEEDIRLAALARLTLRYLVPGVGHVLPGAAAQPGRSEPGGSARLAAD